MPNDPLQPHPEIRKHLLDLHSDARSVLLESVGDEAAGLGRLLQLDLDISIWEDRLSGRPEVTFLRDARRELGFAIYAASSGLYRLAYDGVRLFLELSYASVYFSANELHRRKWISDRLDFSWSKALDKSDGILSADFVREFLPEAVEDASIYAALAQDCYRHCSQFVHGKSAATKDVPQRLSYSRIVLNDWSKTGYNSAISVLYLLFCRYASELKIQDDAPLASTIEGSFSHLHAVRRLIGLPIEQGQ